MRKGQDGQSVATHLRTSLASLQQQSRQRARRAFTGFCALNASDNISEGTSAGSPTYQLAVIIFRCGNFEEWVLHICCHRSCSRLIGREAGQIGFEIGKRD